MKKKTMTKEQKIFALLWLVPLMVAAGFVPLLVRMIVVETSSLEKAIWNYVFSSVDYFNKEKANTLIIAATVAFILFVLRVIIHDIKLKKNVFYWPLGAYVVFVVLSTLAMKYKTAFMTIYKGAINTPDFIVKDSNMALNGFWDHYEGLFVLLAYTIFMVVAYNFVNSKFELEVIFNTVLISSSIIAVICIFQYLGYDLFRSSFGLKMITPSAYEGANNDMIYNFGKNFAYGTLHNPNYVGGYMALILPFAIARTFSENKKKLSRFYCASVVLVLGGLMASNSSTGIIAAFFSVMVLLIAIRKEILKRKYMARVLVIASVAMFIVLNLSSGFRPLRELKSIKDNIALKDSVMASELNSSHSNELIKDIQYAAYGMIFTSERTTIRIEHINGSLTYYDMEGTRLETFTEYGWTFIKDPRYTHYKIQVLPNRRSASLCIGKREINLILDESGIKVMGNGGNPFPMSQAVTTFGFEGKETFATNRGYLWSRSLPIIKETLFIGMGPDTYVTVFPNYDVIGKANYMERTSVLPDKPHNFYIQTAINTGVVSLIAFLALMVIYMIQSIRTIKMTSQNEHKTLIYGIMLLVVSYLISRLANDSVISVSIVLWVMVGCGFALNDMIKKKEFI